MAEKKINAKQLQEICMSLLAAKGVDYKDWIYEQHLNLLLESSGFLADTLKNGKDDK